MREEFKNMVLEGPGQEEYDRYVFETERSRQYPRVAAGTGRLEGKVAVVTGAAGGQGEFIAKVFAQEGAKVACITRKNREGLDRVVGAIKRDGGEAIAIMADVSIEEDWDRIVADTVEAYGKIDVLVNNAGVLDGGNVLNEPTEAFEKLMGIDCYGVFYGMKHCGPEIIKAGGGSIVNTSSIYGAHFGAGNCIAYATAKAAVVGMSRSAAKDLAQYNIRVNTVHPGYILTPMTYVRPANRKILSEASLLGRFGLSEEIAKPVLFLACDDSSFITGQELFVDGGVTINLNTNNNAYSAKLG